MLSTFSIKVLSILIMVNLNSWCNNSNILDICESGSDAFSGSSNSVFCLSVYFVIFFVESKSKCIDKRNCHRQAFGGKRGKFYSPMIRSQSFSKPAHLCYDLPECFFSLTPPLS